MHNLIINPRNDADQVSYRIGQIEDESQKSDMREVLENLMDLYLNLYLFDQFFGEFHFDECMNVPFLVLMDKIEVQASRTGEYHVMIGKVKMILNDQAISLMVQGMIKQQEKNYQKGLKAA